MELGPRFYGLLINGSHATAALTVSVGSGPILLGFTYQTPVERNVDPASIFDGFIKPKEETCRPCRESAHAECVGPKECACPLCDIARTAQEMSAEWDLFDRAEGWKD